MRLLNHLLTTNQLQRKDTEFYLAYTTKINELAEEYEWNIILSYDYTYREIQAEHNFKWGTFSHHMEFDCWSLNEYAKAQLEGGPTLQDRQKIEGYSRQKDHVRRYRHPEAKHFNLLSFQQ